MNTGLFIAILLLPLAIRAYAGLIALIRWGALHSMPDTALRRLILYEFKGKAVAVICFGIVAAFAVMMFSG